MNSLFFFALSLILFPIIASLIRRLHSFSICTVILIIAGLCFSQKSHLNPFNRIMMFSTAETTETLLDSDADGLPDEVEKSGYLPIEIPFAWHQPPESDLFHPWQRFTVASDFKNIGGDLFITPAGYLTFGRPLNRPTLQDYPLANALRRTIPQIAFAQGPNRHIPALGSKAYLSADPRRITFEKLFLDSTNAYASIQATLHPDGRIGLAYQDITGNLAQTRRIGWQLNGGGLSLPTVTNRTAFLLQPFTPTDPLSPDSDQDGLTDYEELFVYHTDPANPSTANDGFPDAWKVAHNLPPAEPILPDTSTDCFGPDWPDASISPFSASDPLNLPLTLHIETSRSAWLTLTWEGADPATRRLPIPGSATPQTLSIPIPRHAQTALSATLAPATDTPGPWRYTLRAQSPDPQWPILQPGDTTLRNRGISTLPRHGFTYLTGAARAFARSTTEEPITLTAYPLAHALEDGYGFCVYHGATPVTLPPAASTSPWAQNANWAVDPPLPHPLSLTPLTFIPTNYLEEVNNTYLATLTLHPPDTHAPPLTAETILHFHGYLKPTPNPIITPAETASGHAPCTFEVLATPWRTTCRHCPDFTDTHIAVGFDHEKVFTRNLEIHPNENDEEKKIMHTLPLFWSAGRILHLEDYVEHSNRVPEGDLIFEGDGIQGSQLIFRDSEPEELTPHIYRILLRYRPTNEILDRLFIVVNRFETVAAFQAWYTRESTDLAWLNDLPPPPLHLSDRQAEVTFNNNTWHWSAPDNGVFNTFLHHTARTELRTATGTFNTLTSGHQACYDENGNLITQGLSAGTADRYSPEHNLLIKRKHRNSDVYPYLQALQLEGNPVTPNDLTIPRRLDRPAMRMSENSFLTRYLECRPPHTERR